MIDYFKAKAASEGKEVYHDSDYRGGKQFRLKCRGCDNFCIIGRQRFSKMHSKPERQRSFQLHRRNTVKEHFTKDVATGALLPCVLTPGWTLDRQKTPKSDKKKRKSESSVIVPSSSVVISNKEVEKEPNKEVVKDEGEGEDDGEGWIPTGGEEEAALLPLKKRKKSKEGEEVGISCRDDL